MLGLGLKHRSVSELPGLPEPPEGMAWVVELVYSSSDRPYRRLDLRPRGLAWARRGTPHSMLLPDLLTKEGVADGARKVLLSLQRAKLTEDTLGVYK